MKKLFLALIASFALMSFHSVFAADLKVGVVNFQEILQKAPQFTELKNKLDKKFTPKQKKIVSAQKALQKDVEKFRRDAAVMKKKAKTKLEKKIMTQQQKLQKMQIDFQKEYMEERNKSLTSLLDKVKAKIARLAKKKDLDLVFTTEPVAYAAKSLDITSDVLKALK